MLHDPQIIAASFVRRLALFYAALFVVIGIQLPFFPVWLQAKGLDAQMIGFVLAAPMVVRVFAIPFVTRIADRRRMLRGVIVAASCAAAAGNLALDFSQGAMAILIVFSLASMAFTPIMPLAEAYALRGLARHRRAYGPVRLWGSAAFIAGSLGAGWIGDSMAPRNLIWLIVAAAGAATLAAAALAPAREAAGGGAVEPPYRGFLRTPGFAAATAAAGLIQASHAVYYGFSSLDWKTAGLDGTVIGALWGIGVLAEITLFAVSGRLPAWVTPGALLTLGGAGAVLRWIMMALGPPNVALPLVQCLHGLSFGATHLGAIGFVARAAPAGMAATAQGNLAVVLGGTMAASMGLSGILYGAFGDLAYAAMALMAATGVLCALLVWRLPR
ncbi:MAG TPA: MFS transporter [Xanthobacteraceae bacterium]|nr:MFS transporter [Xanthobacteraceae bacterium]